MGNSIVTITSLTDEVSRTVPYHFTFDITRPFMTTSITDSKEMLSRGATGSGELWSDSIDKNDWDSIDTITFDDSTGVNTIKITGKKKVFYKYKVEITETGQILKDFGTEINTDISDDVIIPPSVLPQFTPYTIKIYVEYSDGSSETEVTKQIHLYDTKPFLISSNYSNGVVKAQIGDNEGDNIRYRVKLNGNIIFPMVGEWTSYQTPPIDYTQMMDETWSFYRQGVGSANQLVIEAEDSLGMAMTSSPLIFDGQYVGLIFQDASGNPYASGNGSFLRDLVMGTVIAGRTSSSSIVYIQNMTNSSIKDLIISLDETVIPSGTNIKISKDNITYEDSSITFSEEISNGDVKSFYVKVWVDILSLGGGTFYIDATATPV